MTPSRVEYRENQLLQAADLNAEGDYRRALRRRHGLAAHGWGIVYGLSLFVEHGTVKLQPGLAVDGFGREIVVPDCVPVSLTGVAIGTTVGVWLLYDLTLPRRSNAIASRCREGYRLCITPAMSPVDPYDPPGLSARERDFAPYDEPPDDPRQLWPVYVGLVRHEAGRYHTPPVRRPYVPLIGESVTAASGGAQLVVGDERGHAWRFAVRLPVTKEDGTVEFSNERLAIDNFGRATLAGPVHFDRTNEAVANAPAGNLVLADQPSSHLEKKDIHQLTRLITRMTSATSPLPTSTKSRLSNAGGNIQAIVEILNDWIRGRVSFSRSRLSEEESQQGNRMRLAEAFPDIIPPTWSSQLDFEPPMDAPEVAARWHIYRALVPPGEVANAQSRPLLDELRVELYNPAEQGDSNLRQLAVGTAGDNNAFVAPLRITAGGQFVVDGNLKITGQLSQGPIQANPFDERFAAVLVQSWERGHVATVNPTSDLLILFSEDASHVGDREWSYRITVLNVSEKDTVSGIKLVIRESLTSVDPARPTDTSSPRTADVGELMPGEKSELPPQTFKIDANDIAKLKIVVMAQALGTGPTSQIMSSQNSKEYTVAPAE